MVTWYDEPKQGTYSCDVRKVLELLIQTQHRIVVEVEAFRKAPFRHVLEPFNKNNYYNLNCYKDIIGGNYDEIRN